MPDDGTCHRGIRWWADRRGWLTGWVNELRPVPTDPAALKVWVAGLSRDELMALAQQVVGGGLTGRLGALEELVRKWVVSGQAKHTGGGQRSRDGLYR